VSWKRSAIRIVFAPCLGIGVLVRGDVEEREIGKGPAEIRVNAASAQGHGQAVGDLNSPGRRNNDAIIVHCIKHATDRRVVSSP
jgi:hypothetical protein